MADPPPFSVGVKTSARKYLERKRGAERQRLVDAINALRQNPLDPRNKMQGGDGLYRWRVGDGRIVYTVDKAARKITLHAINNRGQVY